MSVRDNGSGDDVILHSFVGDDWRPVKDELRAAGLIHDRPAFARTAPAMPRPSRPAPPVDDGKQRAALRLWNEAVEPAGTIVERYLASRALRLPMDASDVLRFHPACPFGPGVRLPCMVALMRDIRSGQPVAIHRTALTSSGVKIDRKMLGPPKGAAIMLAFEVTNRIGVAEGIETALSVMEAGWSPMWALGTAVGIAGMPVLPHASLTVFADPDPAGQAAALKLATRWADTGQRATIQTPQRGDFNDALKETEHG